MDIDSTYRLKTNSTATGFYLPWYAFRTAAYRNITNLPECRTYIGLIKLSLSEPRPRSRTNAPFT